MHGRLPPAVGLYPPANLSEFLIPPEHSLECRGAERGLSAALVLVANLGGIAEPPLKNNPSILTAPPCL